jgi:hypothetical protein
VQVQSTVRLVTVQKNGHAGDGDVGQAQGDQQHLPPREVKQAMAHPLNHGIQKGPIRQQHEFVFLLTPDFRQFVDFKFFAVKKTAISTESEQNESENLLSDPCCGKKTICGVAVGP